MQKKFSVKKIPALQTIFRRRREISEKTKRMKNKRKLFRERKGNNKKEGKERKERNKKK